MLAEVAISEHGSQTNKELGERFQVDKEKYQGEDWEIGRRAQKVDTKRVSAYPCSVEREFRHHGRSRWQQIGRQQQFKQ